MHLSRGAEALTVCLGTGQEWFSFLPRVSHFLSLAETEDGSEATLLGAGLHCAC